MSNNKLDKAKATRCLLNVQKMPISRFEMLDDRNGCKSARARRNILEAIAGMANPDGTGSYISDVYLRGKTGFTRRHIITLRDELASLGLLEWTDRRGYGSGKDGGWGSNLYTVKFENWPRRNIIRRIFERQGVPEVHDSNLNGEVSELNSEVSASNGEISETKKRLNGEVIASHNRLGLPPLYTAPSTAEEITEVAGWISTFLGQQTDLEEIDEAAVRRTVKYLGKRFGLEFVRPIVEKFSERPKGITGFDSVRGLFTVLKQEANQCFKQVKERVENERFAAAYEAQEKAKRSHPIEGKPEPEFESCPYCITGCERCQGHEAVAV